MHSPGGRPCTKNVATLFRVPFAKNYFHFRDEVLKTQRDSVNYPRSHSLNVTKKSEFKSETI